jgi:hypothetical protein
MTFPRRTILKSVAAATLLALAGLQPVTAFATEVAGVKFDDSVTVNGAPLKLVGAGLRTKVVFKVYALGLYLTEKKNSVADILAAPGPRRVQIVVLRELTSEEFGNAFMHGLNANSDQAERSKLVTQTKQFGEMFASIPGLKKGDVLTVDWIPGSGTQCMLNGKNVGGVLQDQAFYNALLKIWLGDKPVDSTLKAQLLGER